MRCLELRSPCVSLKIIAHLRTFISQSDSSIRSVNIYIYSLLFSNSLDLYLTFSQVFFLDRYRDVSL